MTPKQRIHLMAELWPAAAAALGCPANVRERRIEEIGRALGRPVVSASEIKTNRDFDLVKGHLLALAQPANLNAQVRQENMPRTRLIVGIRKRASEAYIAAICRDKFGTGAWEDLSEPQLEQLRDTLAARAQARNKREAQSVVEAEAGVEVPF